MILVEADAGEEWDSRADWQAIAESAVQAAFRSSRHARLAGADIRIEVSVRLTDDEEVRALNASYRAKDKPTNVLSFPMIGPDELVRLRADVGEALLGDIVLAHGVCTAEAAAKGIAAETHVAHLVVHGTLHLLGYDHEPGDAEAAAMEDVERIALATIGIGDPYLVSEVRT